MTVRRSGAAEPGDQDGRRPGLPREHKDGATSETFVSDNGGLDNVFVYVKDGLGSYYFDTPSTPVKLDQHGCRYRPHVFGVQVGQPLEFVNSDATLHNVHAVPATEPGVQFSQPIQTHEETASSFTKPEVMVPFKCDVHGWMTAYVGVLDHPYFAVTKAGGGFELKNLPAGTYTIEAWHEKLGTQTQTVTVADNDKKEITLTFKVACDNPP